MLDETIMDDDEEMALKEGPQYLLFYLNAQLFGLRAQSVSEIVELPNITKIPWMHPCVKGACNIRGSVVGVVDISQRLMQRDFVRSLKSALVLVNLEFEDTSHRVGIIVDEVLEIEVFETLELQSAPQFGLSFDTKYLESMAHYEGKYIPILSLDRLLWLEELSVLKEL